MVGAAGQGPARVLDDLRGHLAASGWPLDQDAQGVWTACRTRGVLLDSHEVCVHLTGTNGGVAVNLDTTDGW